MPTNTDPDHRKREEERLRQLRITRRLLGAIVGLCIAIAGVAIFHVGWA